MDPAPQSPTEKVSFVTFFLHHVPYSSSFSSLYCEHGTKEKAALIFFFFCPIVSESDIK